MPSPYFLIALLVSTLFTSCSAAPEPDLVYQLPTSVDVQVKSNLVFKAVNQTELKADVYLPSEPSKAPLPAIIFVLGDADPATLKNAKDWRFMKSYGRLAVATGFAGITFNHRSSERFTKLPEVREDILDLLEWVKTKAPSLNVDPQRLALWFFSGSGTHLAVGMGTNLTSIRCMVAYYPVLAPSGVTDLQITKQFSATEQIKAAVPRIPPLLIAKAGRDDWALNADIEKFVKTARELKTSLVFLEHPTGRHAFDILDDDARSREIVRESLDFVSKHLKK